MSRRRFVYREVSPGQVESFEVGRDWTPSGRGNLKSEEEIYGHLTAPDGTDISTRKRHRDYQALHGLTLAEDYKESWKKAAKERARAFTEGPSSKTRRESIERAMYQAVNRRGK